MAKIQLDAAIDAYFEGRGIVAITLAGAAEEIFGAMLKRNGIQNSIEKIASLPPLLENYKSQKERVEFLNSSKNNLKHASNKFEDDFIITELDPFFMIVRALGNSELLKIEDTETMKRFRTFYTSKT
jgi:hypothetical protein